MDFDQNGVGQGTAVLDQGDDMNEQYGALYGQDPGAADSLKKYLPPKPQPLGVKPRQPGKQASWWSRFNAVMSSEPLGKADEVGLAIARGGMKAVDEASNTAVAVSKGVAEMGGAKMAGAAAAKLAGGREGAQRFLDWYDQKAADVNPLTFGADRRREWLGKDAGGALGFVEGATQVAVGMLATRRLSLPTGASKLAEGATALARGAAIDAAFFDPYQHRISNLVESGPEWIRNPITRFLAADPADSELVARGKAAVEGAAVGQAVDATLRYVVKPLTAVMTHRLAATTGKLLEAYRAAKRGENGEIVARLLEEAETLHAAPHPDDVVDVVKRDGGAYSVAPSAPKPLVLGEDGRPLVVYHKTSNPNLEFDKDVPTYFSDSPKGWVGEYSVESHITSSNPLTPSEAKRRVDEIAAAFNAHGLDPEHANEIINFIKRDDPSAFFFIPDEARAAYESLGYDAVHVNDGLTSDWWVPFSNKQIKPVGRAGGAAQAAGRVRQAAAGGVAQLRRKLATAIDPTIEQERRSLLRAAETDPLTDVGNRAALDKALPAAEADATTAVVHFDANNFGQVNKLAGEAEGDKAIQEIARAIKQAADEYGYGNRVFRKGGDEFTVLAPKDKAEAIRSRAEELFGERDYSGTKVSLTGTHGSTFAEAESTLQAAKQARKNGTQPAAASVADDAPTFPTEAEAQSFAASANESHANNGRPRGAVTPEMQQEFLGAYDHFTQHGDGRSIETLLEDTGVNFNYAQSPEEVLNVVKALAATMPDASHGARGNPGSTFAQLAEFAKSKLSGVSDEQMLQFAERVWGGTADLDTHLTAMRFWLWKHAQVTKRLVQAAHEFPDNAVAQDNLAAALDTMYELHAFVTGTSSNVGRALNSMKVEAGEAVEGVVDGLTKEEAEKLAAKDTPAPMDRKSVAGLTKAEIRALGRQIYMADGDPAEILAAILTPRKPKGVEVDPKKWYDYLVQYRMDAMLSGPKTQIMNLINNVLASLQMPTEYWWAGVRTGNAELRQQGADILAGHFVNLGDAARMAKKAWMVGNNVLEDVPSNPSMSSLRHWQDYEGVGGFLAKWCRSPARSLMTTDEFFKQLNYRSSVRAQLLRKYREEGITDAGELASRMVDDMKFVFTPDGGGVNPVAMQYARTATFTNDLGEGTIGKSLQDLAGRHATVRLIAPFIRTPVNIFRYAWERTPLLNRFNKQMQAEIAAGGERAAVAKAKSEMGLLVWGIAGYLAHAKIVTGSGPADPDLRRQWKEAGHQPYSVKVPGVGWVSYRRGDPTFAPFGMAADVYSMLGEMDDTDLGDATAAVMASVASNMSSKTFMQGVTEFMDAASSGRADKMQALLSSVAGSFIPNALRQMNPDDTIRETRGFVDEMMARLPGFSESLEPRRNLFGEKVMRAPGYANQTLNPFTIAGTPKDPNVADELLKLGVAVTMPAETKLDGKVVLTDREKYVNTNPSRKGQSPYDRMLELMGTPLVGGKTLRETLEGLVTSPAYQGASDGVAGIAPGGMKYKLAAAHVAMYQEVAWARVLQEYPGLMQDLIQTQTSTAAALVGGQSAVDSMSKMFGK